MTGAHAFGVVRLADVLARLPVIDVTCNRCDRHGRLRTARLIAQHAGAAADHRRGLSANAGCTDARRVRSVHPRSVEVGGKPKPPKFPSRQIQPRYDRIQDAGDHGATCLPVSACGARVRRSKSCTWPPLSGREKALW